MEPPARPPSSLVRYRLLQLYRLGDPRAAIPRAFKQWREDERPMYGAIVDLGSVQSDRVVLDAVRRVCRATTIGVMGIYAGHNFKAQWEPRRRRVAALLDRCAR
jgi:hypothetical protein